MLTDFIKIPYTTGPNMIKNTGPVFLSPPNQEILLEKRKQLNLYRTNLYGQIQGIDSVIKKSAEFCKVNADNILHLGLELEEDIAIMHKGLLAAIFFCFPSGFIPYKKVGMSLSDIHMPVADNDLLLKASPGITRVMTEQTSFIRYVWTVTANPNLSNYPKNYQTPNCLSFEDLYFRYETQTTAKLDETTSLFFVKVNVIPLKDVWDKKILDSINTMSESVLNYKNLNDIKKILNSYFKE